jgi:hypothetical protein
MPALSPNDSDGGVCGARWGGLLDLIAGSFETAIRFTLNRSGLNQMLKIQFLGSRSCVTGKPETTME